MILYQIIYIYHPFYQQLANKEKDIDAIIVKKMI